MTPTADLSDLDVQNKGGIGLLRPPDVRIFAFIIPLFLQAWLLVVYQTRTTRLLRLLLVPVGFYLAGNLLQYDFLPRDAFRALNCLKDVGFPLALLKTVEFGLVGHRYFWIGYERAKDQNADGRTPANQMEMWEDEPPKFMSLEALSLASSLLTTRRGHGWNWGIGGPFLFPPFPQEHFLKDALLVHLRAHVVLVISLSLIQYSGFPLVDNDFLRGLGVPQFPLSSWIGELLVAITFGTVVWNLLDLIHMQVAICAYFFYALIRTFHPRGFSMPPFDSRAWPPLLQNPFCSTSLRDGWTYRWHSMMRRELFFVGYKPTRYITRWLGTDISRLFGVLAAFALSGIAHEIAIQAGTREFPIDTRLFSVCFFMLQGLGVVAEQIFEKRTGRKVGGWAGRVWLILAVGLPGANLVRGWLGRRLLENIPTPDTWEWWRWAFPSLMYLPRVHQ